MLYEYIIVYHKRIFKDMTNHGGGGGGGGWGGGGAHHGIFSTLGIFVNIA